MSKHNPELALSEIKKTAKEEIKYINYIVELTQEVFNNSIYFVNQRMSLCKIYKYPGINKLYYLIISVINGNLILSLVANPKDSLFIIPITLNLYIRDGDIENKKLLIILQQLEERTPYLIELSKNGNRIYGNIQMDSLNFDLIVNNTNKKKIKSYSFGSDKFTLVGEEDFYGFSIRKHTISFNDYFNFTQEFDIELAHKFYPSEGVFEKFNEFNIQCITLDKPDMSILEEK